jgi:chemotaxis protein CheY-P-specific phosphatase CheC
MEKPVRIQGNEKIRSFNEKVRHGIEHALNFMLASDEGAKFSIGAFEPFLMPIEAYLEAYKKKSVMIKIFADKAYKGELYWFFEIKTAVVLGSLLRMLPASSLNERLDRMEFDEMDQDAFGEVGNQLCGILDRAFRALTTKNIHLRMDFKKKVYPDETIQIGSFQNKEEYVVLLCSITHAQFGTQKITLLLPRSLYEVLLNLELDLDGITPKLVLLYSWNEEQLEALQTELNTRYTKIIPLRSADEVITKCEMPGVVAAGVNMKSLGFPLTHNDTIFIKRLAGHRGLSKVPFFFSWENSKQPEVDELRDMGLTGATPAAMAQHFSRWVKAFTQDPAKK